jgi:acid phosphatase family membrane protein YuiD
VNALANCRRKRRGAVSFADDAGIDAPVGIVAAFTGVCLLFESLEFRRKVGDRVSAVCAVASELYLRLPASTQSLI